MCDEVLPRIDMLDKGLSESDILPVFFMRRVIEFSSSFGFPRNKQVPSFFLGVILRLINTHIKNLSFTFVICPLMISQNTIDF